MDRTHTIHVDACHDETVSLPAPAAPPDPTQQAAAPAIQVDAGSGAVDRRIDEFTAYALDGARPIGRVEVDRRKPSHCLGVGGFGEVWSAKLYEERTNVAHDVVVKYFGVVNRNQRNQIDRRNHALEDFRHALGGAHLGQEVRQQTAARGERSQLVATIGISVRDRPAIIMRPGRGVSLAAIVSDGKVMQNQSAVMVCIGVNKAISEMLLHHDGKGNPEPLGHYDIKPRNIMTDMSVAADASGRVDPRNGINITQIDLDSLSNRAETSWTPGYSDVAERTRLLRMNRGFADRYGRQEVFAQARLIRRLVTGVEPAQKIIDLWGDDPRLAYVVELGEAPLESRIGNEGYRKLLQGYVAGTSLDGLKAIATEELRVQGDEIATFYRARKILGERRGDGDMDTAGAWWGRIRDGMRALTGSGKPRDAA